MQLGVFVNRIIVQITIFVNSVFCWPSSSLVQLRSSRIRDLLQRSRSLWSESGVSVLLCCRNLSRASTKSLLVERVRRMCTACMPRPGACFNEVAPGGARVSNSFLPFLSAALCPTCAFRASPSPAESIETPLLPRYFPRSPYRMPARSLVIIKSHHGPVNALSKNHQSACQRMPS